MKQSSATTSPELHTPKNIKSMSFYSTNAFSLCSEKPENTTETFRLCAQIVLFNWTIDEIFWNLFILNEVRQTGSKRRIKKSSLYSHHLSLSCSLIHFFVTPSFSKQLNLLDLIIFPSFSSSLVSFLCVLSLCLSVSHSFCFSPSYIGAVAGWILNDWS